MVEMGVQCTKTQITYGKNKVFYTNGYHILSSMYPLLVVLKYFASYSSNMNHDKVAILQWMAIQWLLW